MTPSTDPDAVLGKLIAVEAALVFLLKREFEREVVPRVATSQWFEHALDAASMPVQAAGPDAAAGHAHTLKVMDATYQALLTLRAQVLDGML